MLHKSFYGETLFEDVDRERIIGYKYKGVDCSLYYKYIMSPFCDLLVRKVFPIWMASNNKSKSRFFTRSHQSAL